MNKDKIENKLLIDILERLIGSGDYNIKDGAFELAEQAKNNLFLLCEINTRK
jgi:hypothetical protein